MLTKNEARKYYAPSYNEQSTTDRLPIPKKVIQTAILFAQSEIDRIDGVETNIMSIFVSLKFSATCFVKDIPFLLKRLLDLP